MNFTFLDLEQTRVQLQIQKRPCACAFASIEKDLGQTMEIPGNLSDRNRFSQECTNSWSLEIQFYGRYFPVGFLLRDNRV